ncbi:MAG: hypothetical protein HUJ76_04860 [Parasporobacterium sp.]|nr:hypothetical protein [Parasporobacterium sp.]
MKNKGIIAAAIAVACIAVIAYFGIDRLLNIEYEPFRYATMHTSGYNHMAYVVVDYEPDVSMCRTKRQEEFIRSLEFVSEKEFLSNGDVVKVYCTYDSDEARKAHVTIKRDYVLYEAKHLEEISSGKTTETLLEKDYIVFNDIDDFERYIDTNQIQYYVVGAERNEDGKRIYILRIYNSEKEYNAALMDNMALGGDAGARDE